MPNQENTVKLTAEISASSNGLISALKQASSAINDTTSTWQDKFKNLKDSTGLISQAVKNLGDMVSKAGAEGGMEQMVSSLGEVQSMFNKVQAEVTVFSQSLAELKNRASELNMPVEEYQAFAVAIENANSSMEQGNTAIQTMQKNIADMMNGVPEAQAMFEQLGISMETLGSNSVMGNFEAIASAIQAVVPPTDQAKASMDLFGTSIQDVLHVSQEYNKLLSNQAENAFASDKDIQNAISLTGAIGKLGDQITKIADSEKKAFEANSAFSSSYRDLFNLINQGRNELTDLFTSYANYVESLKRSVTSTLDSTKALEVFSAKVKEISWEIQEAISDAIEQGKAESTDDTEVQIIPVSSLKRLDEAVFFVTKARQKIEEEMVAVSGIMNQRIDAGAPVDTKELETARQHVEMLKTAFEELSATIDDAKEGGYKIEDDTLADVEALGVILEDAGNKLTVFEQKANKMNVDMGIDALVGQLSEFAEKLEQVKSEGGQILDTKELDEAQAKLNEITRLISEHPELHIEVDTLPLKDLQTEINNLRDEISVMAYDAEKNGFERVYDGAKKLGSILRQPIRNARELGSVLRELGAKSLSGAKNAVIELGKAFVNPIAQAQKLKAKMDEFVASTHKAKTAVDSIGNGSGDMKSNMGQTAVNAKQVLGQIVGMGGKLGFIVWAGKTFLGSLKMWVQGFTEANKQAREMQEILSKQQTEVAQNNESRANGLADDLRKYAELREKVGKEGNATDKVELQKMQREIEAKYGVDLKSGAKEFREAFEWADNMKKDAIQSQIDALEKLNKSLRDEDTELQSTWKNFLNHGVSSSGWKQVYDRRSDIQGEIGENASKIAELRSKLRLEQTRNGYGDLKSEYNAKKQDELRKAQEEQRKALESATGKLREWAQSLTDTERQKDLREIMQKYNEAVKGGVKESEARAVAIKAINEMLKKEKEEEDRKNAELLKAMEDRITAYKQAYEAYVKADREVVDAKKQYAKIQSDLNREARAERLQKARERLQKRMGSFGFTPFAGFKLDESSSARRERRREVQLDQSINEKMSKAQAGNRVHWTRNERERIAEFGKLQRQDRAIEAVQKQMDAAKKQEQAAKALEEAAKAIRSAMLGRADAGKDLKDAGKNLREANRNRRTRSVNGTAQQVFEGAKRNLSARGVGSAMKQSQVTYNDKLDKLHKDLQDIQKHTYFVK